MPYRPKNASTNAGSTAAVPALTARMLARSSRGMSESSTDRMAAGGSPATAGRYCFTTACHPGTVNRSSIAIGRAATSDCNNDHSPPMCTMGNVTRPTVPDNGGLVLASGRSLCCNADAREASSCARVNGMRFGTPVVPEVSISMATDGSPPTASLVPRTCKASSPVVEPPAGRPEIGDGAAEYLLPPQRGRRKDERDARCRKVVAQPVRRLQRTNGHQRASAPEDRDERRDGLHPIGEHDGDPTTRADIPPAVNSSVDLLGERPNGTPGLPVSVALHHAVVVVGVPEPSQRLVDARHFDFPDRLPRRIPFSLKLVDMVY